MSGGAVILPRETQTSGNRVIIDVSGLIHLYAGVETGGRFTTFRRAQDTTGYAVTASTTLTIIAARFTSVNTSAGIHAALLYGDNDVALNVAGAPTTPVYAFGLDGAIADIARNFMTLRAVIASGEVNMSVEKGGFKWEIPAGKFPALKITGGNSGSVDIWGSEA